MRIFVTSGHGTGITRVSAFDDALNSARIANYNLIQLSSVIPPGSEVTRERGPDFDDWGNRLYVVMSAGYADTPGMEVWAGIGWIQHEDGRGLFVEYSDSSEHNVRDMVVQSLEEMTARRGDGCGQVSMHLERAVCVSAPACALVAAVFSSEPW